MDTLLGIAQVVATFLLLPAIVTVLVLLSLVDWREAFRTGRFTEKGYRRRD
jgi:hypothetical protein